MENDNKVPNYKLAKEKAEGLLQRLNYTRPQVSPIAVAKFYGLDVFDVIFTEDKKISGYYDAINKAILVNAEIHVNRKTFTIAHELGHVVLHGESGSREDIYAYGAKPPKEQEADCFAANLLVPRFMLDNYRFMQVDEIAKIFGVSTSVIANRIAIEYGR